jgi:uncharacterized membrane protein required for colicin V production
MNWSDYAVLAIILVFGIVGLVNGFIFSIFKIASFFASILLSIKFYPVFAEALQKTVIFDSIKASVLKSLTAGKQTAAVQADAQFREAAADSVVNRLPLPDFLKASILQKIPEPSKLVDLNSIMDTVSSEIARVIVGIISLILLYVLIRVALFLARFILRGIAKLPVFKQVDKLGGFAFGAVEGLLTVYILCAVLVLFNSSPQFVQIFQTLDTSLFAKFFYRQNFIVDWMYGARSV